VNARTVTFEQIVQLAFPGQHQPNVVFLDDLPARRVDAACR
jgi:hypothetical protein